MREREDVEPLQLRARGLRRTVAVVNPNVESKRDVYTGPATIVQHGSSIPVTCTFAVGALDGRSTAPDWSGQFRTRTGNGIDLKGPAALSLPSGATAKILVVAVIEGRGIFVGEGRPPAKRS